jgi:hypothetical protein
LLNNNQRVARVLVVSNIFPAMRKVIGVSSASWKQGVDVFFDGHLDGGGCDHAAR